jgi:Transcriptional regulator/sugar kinase
MKNGNSAMVRRINREVIRNALKARGSANIAELSRLTRLSPATCSNILPELILDGEVFELDERQSGGGRPARVYAYNPDHTLVAAILLRYGADRTTIRHSVRNSAGAVISAGLASPEPFTLEALDEVLDRLIRDHPAIRVLALSIPGVVENGTVELCDVVELWGVNMEERLKSRFSLETVMENDMNFAAVGYASRHPEAARSGLAYINIPEGKCPGCGIVVGGRLLKGKSNFAGELSYIPFAGAPKEPFRHGDRSAVVEVAARLCCVLAAAVNPDAVVIAGDVVGEDMAGDIRAWCLDHIPGHHLPEIIAQHDYEEDCFDGMLAMALEALSCDVRLVEKKRSWSGG